MGKTSRQRERVIRFCILASGSKGNAIWVEAGGVAVLVDAGLPARELGRRMVQAGLAPERLRAILVSHEHRDHILGVGPLARKLGLPVLVNEPTLARAEGFLGRIRPRLFLTGEDFELGPLAVHPFSLSHDAADPVGFTFEHRGVRLGLATDLGASTALVRDRLAGCQALIVEANHDPQMLLEGPYPWEIKQRVRGRRGHLSNEDAAGLLAAVLSPGLTRVVLAHLSQVNNEPRLALARVGAALAEAPAGFRLEAARQDEPGRLREV